MDGLLAPSLAFCCCVEPLCLVERTSRRRLCTHTHTHKIHTMTSCLAAGHDDGGLLLGVVKKVVAMILSRVMGMTILRTNHEQ